MPHEPSTIAGLLKEAQERLEGSATARLDAEVLMACVLGRARTHLYGSSEQSVAPGLAARYRQLITERVRRVPMAYLTGWREFWSLALEVNVHTLVPRPETEHLVDLALALIRTEALNDIADLGTGSGNLALAIASECPGSRVLATDISEEALALARRNAQRLGLTQVGFRRGDWYQALRGETFDLIVSNPPYLARRDPYLLRQEELSFEPPIALDGGEDGLEAITCLIAGARAHLRPGGWLALEHGYDQRAAVQRLLHDQGFEGLHSVQDYGGRDRLSAGRCP